MNSEITKIIKQKIKNQFQVEFFFPAINSPKQAYYDISLVNYYFVIEMLWNEFSLKLVLGGRLFDGEQNYPGKGRELIKNSHENARSLVSKANVCYREISKQS